MKIENENYVDITMSAKRIIKLIKHNYITSIIVKH